MISINPEKGHLLPNKPEWSWESSKDKIDNLVLNFDWVKV